MRNLNYFSFYQKLVASEIGARPTLAVPLFKYNSDTTNRIKHFYGGADAYVSFDWTKAHGECLARIQENPDWKSAVKGLLIFFYCTTANGAAVPSSVEEALNHFKHETESKEDIRVDALQHVHDPVYVIEPDNEDDMVKALHYGMLAATLTVKHDSLKQLKVNNDDEVPVYECKNLKPNGSTTHNIFIVGATLMPLKQHKESYWTIKHTHGDTLGGNKSGLMKIRMSYEENDDCCGIAKFVYFIPNKLKKQYKARSTKNLVRNKQAFSNKCEEF